MPTPEHILFTWLGLMDAKTPESLKQKPDDFGPLIRTIQQPPQNEPYTHLVILWDKNDSTLYKKNESGTKWEPLIEDYENLLRNKFKRLDIKTYPFDDIPNFTDLRAIYRATREVLGKASEDAIKYAFLTAGAYVQPLAFLLLAPEYRLRMVTASKERVDLLPIPLPPYESYLSSFARVPEMQNRVLLAWLGGPPPKNSAHHDWGPLVATLADPNSNFAHIHLLIDYSPRSFSAQALADSQKAISDIREGGTPDESWIDKLSDEAINIRFRLGALKEVCKEINKKGLPLDNLTIEHVPIADPVGDFSSIYFTALSAVQEQTRSSWQPVFLLNSGTKMNTIAWVLLKLWFPKAELIEAWKDVVRKIDLRDLSGNDPLEDFWRFTSQWFENNTDAPVPHNSKQGKWNDFPTRLRELWSWIPDNWIDGNEASLVALHQAIKNISPHYCSRSSDAKLSLGSIVLLGALAYRSCRYPDDGNPFLKLDPWNLYPKHDLCVIGPQDGETFKKTVRQMFGFLQEAFLEGSLTGVEWIGDGDELIFHLKWNAKRPRLTTPDQPSLQRRVAGIFTIPHSVNGKQIIPIPFQEEGSAHLHLVQFLVLAQINAHGFGSPGSFWMDEDTIHIVGR